jgi:hypothetical protein
LAYWQKRIGTEVEPEVTSSIVPAAQISAILLSLQTSVAPSLTVDLKGRFKIEVAENIDETTIQVLQEPGRDPTSRSYMWVFRRGDPEKPVLSIMLSSA